MNFENIQNKDENLEKPQTDSLENDDLEKMEEGEISEASLAEIKRAEQNIAEIASLDDEEIAQELENNPEKKAKISNLLSKAKEWGTTIAGVIAMGASAINYQMIGADDVINNLNQMETVSFTSSAGIAGALIAASTVFTLGSIFVKNYLDFSKKIDADRAEKK